LLTAGCENEVYHLGAPFFGTKAGFVFRMVIIENLIVIARIMNKDNNDRKYINHCYLLMDIQELDLKRSLLMTRSQLEILVKRGESEILEFKNSTGNISSGIQTACAFLNSNHGGAIIVVQLFLVLQMFGS